MDFPYNNCCIFNSYNGWTSFYFDCKTSKNPNHCRKYTSALFSSCSPPGLPTLPFIPLRRPPRRRAGRGGARHCTAAWSRRSRSSSCRSSSSSSPSPAARPSSARTAPPAVRPGRPPTPTRRPTWRTSTCSGPTPSCPTTRRRSSW